MNLFPEGFDCVDEVVQIQDLTLTITRPRSAEALITEEEYANDERLPYWADIWPSGRVLAEELARRELVGTRILELGAGLSLPSLTGLAHGALPLATDWYPDALSFARANAARAGFGALATMEVDWSYPPDALFLEESFDLIIGADIAYERRHAQQLGALLTRLATPATEVLLADPRRPDASALIELLKNQGWSHQRDERRLEGHIDEQGPVVYLHRFFSPNPITKDAHEPGCDSLA